MMQAIVEKLAIFFLNKFSGALSNSWRLTGSILNITRLNFGEKEIWLREGQTRGIEPTHRETSDRGKEKKRVQNRPEFYIPIATERDWVAFPTTLFQLDWRTLCQSTLPVAGQFCRWISCS